MMPYIKMFTDVSDTIDLLSDEEAGRLFKALMHYGNDNEDIIDLPGQEKLIFSMLKTQIDRDAATYQDKCEKLKENGAKGGRPKKANGFSEKQMDTEETICKEDKDKEKEEDKDKDKEKEVKKASSRFTPPSINDVSAYCAERNNGISADRFVDFYTSKGWRIGNQPMKDWKAAVRNWERRDSKPTVSRQKTVRAAQYDQRSYTEDQLANVADDPIIKALEARCGA